MCNGIRATTVAVNRKLSLRPWLDIQNDFGVRLQPSKSDDSFPLLRRLYNLQTSMRRSYIVHEAATLAWYAAPLQYAKQQSLPPYTAVS